MPQQSPAFEMVNPRPAAFRTWESKDSIEVRRPRDPVMEGFVQALLPPKKAEEVLCGFYTDTLHSTLMDRLAALRRNISVAEMGNKSTSLQTWRLKRAYQYVDANLDKPIRLAGLAKAAGLSPMHFAAQFRAPTGLRPSDYVARRRVQHAKSMLRDSDDTIVTIALNVGYQTQAHFTTVFKHLVGLTPHRWRELERPKDRIGPNGAGSDCIA
jgi:AraC family transcriptional regulator